MPSGAKCQAPALRGKPYCYFHTRPHRFTAQPPIGIMDTFRLPVLEDRSAIQIALAQVLDALCSCRIDTRKAGLLLYTLQIASQNVERNFDFIPTTAVESITHTDTGEELGPVERTCCPDDCAACAIRETCEDSRLEGVPDKRGTFLGCETVESNLTYAESADYASESHRNTEPVKL